MTLPPMAEFLRWAAERPAALAAAPAGFASGRTQVRAVVADLFESLAGTRPEAALLQAFVPAGAGRGERNRLRWVLAACHVLWHPAVRGARPARPGLERLLVQEMAELAAIVDADKLDLEEERREELVRRVLRGAGLLPGDESAQEFADRLAQVDSVERHRLVQVAAEKERRARQVREEMAKKAAAEAAAKASRE